MHSRLAATASLIDRLVAAIGRAVIWLSLAVVLVQFAVVVLRYAFGIGSIWLSESIIYGHAAMFMLAAAWTLLLLLPFMAVIAWFALPYVARSWTVLERSRESSGLPFVYLLKTLIPVFALLMALQGVAQAIRAALVLMTAPTASAGTR